MRRNIGIKFPRETDRHLKKNIVKAIFLSPYIKKLYFCPPCQLELSCAQLHNSSQNSMTN